MTRINMERGVRKPLNKDLYLYRWACLKQVSLVLKPSGDWKVFYFRRA